MENYERLRYQALYLWDVSTVLERCGGMAETSEATRLLAKAANAMHTVWERAKADPALDDLLNRIFNENHVPPECNVPTDYHKQLYDLPPR